MYAIHSKLADAREDERGFTLAELVATIVIIGILVTIAVIIFLALLERWRVDAATTQLVGDLRRAHGSATNQLTDWRLVLALDRREQEEGPDYYLVRLAEPYDAGDPGPVVARRLPRTFPGNVKVTNVITPAGSVVDDQGANYWAPPWSATPSPPVPQTRTLEFNTDGTMTFFRSPSGSACVTVDTLPQECRTSQAEVPRPAGRRSLGDRAGDGLAVMCALLTELHARSVLRSHQRGYAT